ncbi:hypothetical protein BGW39_009301 [Mortierella sp. 14UC]|nr:hypothetical protein BGW39_009301 [Mortierella sp. 14UC]
MHAGVAVAFRFADWHPDLVEAVVSVCTPDLPFTDYPVPVDMTVEHFPTLRCYNDPGLILLLDSNPREYLKGIYETSWNTIEQASASVENLIYSPVR